MRKLRILHVINSLQKGGAERLVLDICNNIQNRDLAEVMIVTLNPVNEYIDLSATLNIKNTTSSVKLSVLGKTQYDVSDYIAIVKSFNPDIIHSHLFLSEILSRAVSIPGVRYFSHLHGYENKFSNFNVKTILSKSALTTNYEKKWLIKKYSLCNNTFIAISNYVLVAFKKTMPPALHNIYLLLNSIDLGNFRGIEHKQNIPIKLISAGSFSKKKNQSFLLNLQRHLLNRSFTSTLDILGDGPLKEHLINYAENLGINKTVRFHGNVNNINDFFLRSDIFVHAAKYEAFGLVLLEAMASGLPVVCLDGKGNRDLIRDGVNGFIIEKEDVNLFAEKILWLVNHPEEYSRMSREAIAFARQFDINPYVDRLLELYRAAINS